MEMTRLSRQSNYELLRIIAMAMILVGHFIVHGLQHGQAFLDQTMIQNPMGQYMQVIIFSFLPIGVNLFILISGFFRIRLRWTSLIHFCLLCIFYNLIDFLIFTINNDVFSIKEFVKVFLISKTGNWFFRAYFWLLLISPLLNKAIEGMNEKTYDFMVGCLVFLNCVSGYLLQSQNVNGFNVLHFIFIYCVGAWIQWRKAYLDQFPKYRYLLAYIICSLMIAGLALCILIFTTSSINIIFYYHNPLIVLSSVAVFLFISKYSFTSRFVNSFASTVVAALFLQEVIFEPGLYQYMKSIYGIYGDGLILYGIIVGLSIALLLLAFVIEYPRKHLTTALINRILPHLPPLPTE